MATITDIRDILEGYCIDSSIVSDSWIQSRIDNYVIPVIINGALNLSVSGETNRTVYLNGTGNDILFLPDKNIISIVSIEYVNTQSDYTPSLDNFVLISEEGILKAKYNFNESFVTPVFPKGQRNIKVTYKMGYESVNVPAKLNELICYLTVIEILKWIEGRSGGGNVTSYAFSKQYGDKGKYTNIRRELAHNCSVIISQYRSAVV